MKRNSYANKAFFGVMSMFVIFLFYVSVKSVKHSQKIILDQKDVNFLQLQEKFENLQRDVDRRNSNMKYILQWTPSNTVPFIYMGAGQQGFIDRNCSFTNCFVTDDRSYFGGDYTKFDVIVFAGPQLVQTQMKDLPKYRSQHQKFVFASIESPDYYPICSHKLDNFFNWTWTYKLDPEARWGYMVIKDAQGKVIGPNREMHWLKSEEMEPVNKELKNKLRSKSRAAAWFVSNCHSRSGREYFVKDLQTELNKYGLEVDVYGSCGPFKCPIDKHEDRCYELIENDYYFYLSFENSFAEDYVTEKLMTSLKNNAVPVVFGSANYSRYMPDGIYLNARELGANKLAAKMNELIKDFDAYTEYFRWKKHYSYHELSESPETDEHCSFCSMLNDKDLVKKTSLYPDFNEWWDPPNRC